VFTGPLLGLWTIDNYPPLVSDATIYGVGLSSVALMFAASFVIIRDKSLPLGMPLSTKMAFRAGWGLCTAFLLLGIGGIANGWGMPLSTRDVAAVAKHQTRQRDPARRTFYVAVRAWPGKTQTVDLPVPRSTYEALDLPIEAIDTPQAVEAAMPDAARVRLTVGQGRPGLRWLQSVGLADTPPAN